MYISMLISLLFYFLILVFVLIYGHHSMRFEILK